jgi:GGDEF domain-containing protein
MPLDTATKNQLAQLGRDLALLFNRAMMYQPNHPFVERSIDTFYQSAVNLLDSMAPLVFILNHDVFFLDEEPLDPRLNVSRLVTLFKNHGIQSISFERGLEKRDVQNFLEVFSEISRYGDAERFKKAIFARGVAAIRVNHVRYKKVTEDHRVISRKTLEDLTPRILAAKNEAIARKKFMDTLLESVTTEAFARTLNLESLMADPAIVSKNMIQAELAQSAATGPETGDATGEGAGPGGAGTGAAGHGVLLFQQLQVMRAEVDEQLEGNRQVAIADLAGAVFDMKKHLLEGIEAQKTLGIAYENEAAILENADELADRVLIQLVKEEYRQGTITATRMAQIIRRLVPGSTELKRMLPKIKTALIEEGMPHAQYLELIRELGKELQSEGLAAMLQESGEAIGVDGDHLIAEFKRNPEQAAQLIYLASEIRKGTGNGDVLADILTGYVEQIGSHLAMDEARDRDDPEHLKQVVGGIESKIVSQLGKLDVNDDVIGKVEKRLNARMEKVLAQIRSEWSATGTPSAQGGVGEGGRKSLSVLATLEQSVSDHDELGTILKMVRKKVAAGEIDENDYKKIQDEISRQKQLIKEREDNRAIPAGVIKPGAMAFILEKEIAKANRYDYYFSTLAFSMVGVKPQVKIKAGAINNDMLIETVLALMADTFREVDIVGQLGKNTIVVVLPLIDREASKRALTRVMGILQDGPIDVGGIPVKFKFAGIAMTFDGQQTPDLKSFVRVTTRRLQDMANRLKNIQSFM